MKGILFFKIDRQYLKIKMADILYVQAEKRSITIATKKESYSAQISIGELEKMLPSDIFCRVHRCYIVSLGHTDGFDNDLVFVGNKKIPIGKQHKAILRNSVVVVHGISKPLTVQNAFDGPGRRTKA